MKTFIATLLDSYFISSFVKHFVLQVDDAFRFIAGQFITIHFSKDNKSLKRSYSIATSPETKGRIEFAAGFVKNGAGTDYLFNLKPGTELTLSGPYGRLTLKEPTPKRYIFVATSTGVTPFKSMIPELERRLVTHPNLEIIILLGVRGNKDIIYQEEWLNFAKKNPRVTFRVHFSQQSDEILTSYQYHGRVQTAFPELNLSPETDEVYLCGNPGMIDEAFEYLKAHNFTVQQVIREKYFSNLSNKGV